MNFQHPNELRKKYDFIAKKSFGQNFLVHTPTLKTLSEKILQLKPKSILEIGPGPGSLTQWLIPHVEQMVVVEKDEQFAVLLHEILHPAERVKIVVDDFLTCKLDEILKNCPKPLFAAGNLPYHVSVAILKKLFDHREHFSEFFLMFQKEVAERLCAKPNSKAYGSLSLYTQFLAAAKILLPIPPSAFDPRPKIDSAVVQLSLYPPNLNSKVKLSLFEKIIQAAFSQRRKTLVNCLCAHGFFEGNKDQATRHLQSMGLSGKERAESLGLNDFIQLSLSLDLSS